jgi:hypothetical protein
MKHYEILKWLIEYNDYNEIMITEKPVNRHIPINRMLEEVGYYDFTFTQVNDVTYCVVYDLENDLGKVLVSKVFKDEDGQGLTHMESSDVENMQLLANNFLKKKSIYIN